MANGFVVKSGTVALSSGVAKTIMNLITGTRPLILTEFGVSFDGVTASATPVLVELCGSTQATAGTPGSSPTPTPIRPMAGDASIATAGVAYSAEPTVVTAIKQWLITPNGGVLVMQFPLGRELWSTTAASSAGKGLVIRCNAPAGVNVVGYMEFEE